MATASKTTAPKKNKKQITAHYIITAYMQDTLEYEKSPTSIYKFAKDHDITEADFYKHFGNFNALRSAVWTTFYTMTIETIQLNKDYQHFTNKDKMLTFYFTFFELLTLNRSYVLFALQQHKNKLKNLEQLNGLRKQVNQFARDLIQDRNESQANKLLQRNEMIYAQGAWIQTLFLLKFWMDDSSSGFEKTDMAIEKSVNTIFDLFDNTPLDTLFDFGKFIWKERMNA